MNERIKELAEQAGKYADETQPRGSYTRDGMWLYAYNEKFAELIVRECVNVALEQKKQVEEMEVYNLQDEVWNRARIQQSEHIVDKIKQHFGVEE
jgi:hypothetical protein